ncbi:MAG: TetR/AcrR family transcriptional regulator [Acutalibacteraceae bacterium]
MKKMDIRVKRTYNQLMDALFRLLAKKRFEDITVLEICEEASVHRATFYKHFVDKYDFLNTCFKIQLSKLNLDKPENIYTADSMKKSCMSMISKVLYFVEQNKQLLAYVSDDKFSIAINTALHDSVAEFISDRIKTIKDLNERLNNQIPMLANYYAGAIVGLVKWWVTTETPCPIQELFDFAEFKINDLCNYFNMFV